MGLTTQRRCPKFIFVQMSGTYTYMEAQKVLKIFTKVWGLHLKGCPKKSKSSFTENNAPLSTSLEKRFLMYDQYKVNLKARVLQVSFDESKMSFQTSLC